MTPEKILVIEYSPTIQCLLKAELGETLNAEVFEARSRKIAGDILDREGQKFSLIILNWRLQKRDGFEVFWQIQAEADLQKISLVVMAEKKETIELKIPRYFERYFEFLSLPLVREKLWRAIASAKKKAGRSHLFIESGQPGYPLHAIGTPAMIFEDDYRVYAHNGWIFREGYLGDITLLRHGLDSQQHLHAEGEAAIEFSDGYRLYFHHGV
ncbi:response regulator, partial [Lyngbya sp. CCY1209]|nr:response regulator [Lyngbya sp. CCY1209]